MNNVTDFMMGLFLANMLNIEWPKETAAKFQSSEKIHLVTFN